MFQTYHQKTLSPEPHHASLLNSTRPNCNLHFAKPRKKNKWSYCMNQYNMHFCCSYDQFFCASWAMLRPALEQLTRSLKGSVQKGPSKTKFSCKWEKTLYKEYRRFWQPGWLDGLRIWRNCKEYIASHFSIQVPMCAYGFQKYHLLLWLTNCTIFCSVFSHVEVS
jgi:hypothetical protein